MIATMAGKHRSWLSVVGFMKKQEVAGQTDGHKKYGIGSPSKLTA
jgi:hypothetical protein